MSSRLDGAPPGYFQLYDKYKGDGSDIVYPIDSPWLWPDGIRGIDVNPVTRDVKIAAFRMWSLMLSFFWLGYQFDSGVFWFLCVAAYLHGCRVLFGLMGVGSGSGGLFSLFQSLVSYLASKFMKLNFRFVADG